MAEERQRLLCFEFLPKGGLDKYISDASGGLQWRTRYQIIRGICEGLHYLHEHKIVHVDLKPANILLDSYMVPKIADFGLSKFFGEKQTHAITSKLLGSQGYMAPEFYSRVITFKSDIYSLGVIIIEILTGQKGYPEIQNLLGNWSARFETLLVDIRLEHIKVCVEIAIKCIDPNPAKRPDTQRIIELLDEMECTYGFINTECCTSLASQEILGSSDLEKYTPELLGTTNAEVACEEFCLGGTSYLSTEKLDRDLSTSSHASFVSVRPCLPRLPLRARASHVLLLRRLPRRQLRKKKGACTNGNMGDSIPEFKATDPGMAALERDYNRWVVEQNRRIGRLVRESLVVIFARRGCCMCHVMRRLLAAVGAHATVIELEAASSAAAAAVPALFVGGAPVGGLDGLMGLHLSGLLVPRLREVGALCG
ncbi:unnamed protein product [Urochloa humidicola]